MSIESENRRLESHLHSVAEQVEKTLDELLPGSEVFPTLINQAMRYSTLGGGKRLRAFLAVEACRIVGGEVKKALPLGAAIEMIHAYSLIHDDLPCMDDDDFRRGKPSNHKVYGEGMAVLAGDGLLTEAFHVLSRLTELSGASCRVSLQIIQIMAACCGVGGLIGGQTADISSAGASDPELLHYIHQNKTGALFKASLWCGALLAGATDLQLKALDSYGEHFGIAFQIVDDLLDVVGEPEKLGKAVGTDQALNKLTFPKVYGLEQSRKMAQDQVKSAQDALEIFEEKAGALKALAEYILRREN
jgi:geranylgeranyl diphosphate synthase type II